MRRLLRFVLIGGLVVVLLLLIGAIAVSTYGSASLRRVTAELEREIGPLEVAARPPRASAAEARAGRWLWEGAAALQWDEEERQRVRRLIEDVEPEDWSAEDRRFAVARVEAEAEALAALIRAGAEPSARLSDPSIPSGRGAHGELLRAARLLSLDARLALVDGDEEQLRASLASLSRLSDAMAARSSLLALLMAEAVERARLEFVRDVVRQGAAQPATAAALEEELRRGPDLEASLSRALAHEAVGARGALPGVVATGPGSASGATQWLVVGDLFTAELLDFHVALQDELDRPLPDVGSTPLDASVWTPLGNTMRRIWSENMFHVVRDVRATSAARSLGRLAVALHGERLADAGPITQADVERHVQALGDDPFEGLALDVELADDGGAVLALEPAAVALGTRDASQRPVRWTVP